VRVPTFAVAVIGPLTFGVISNSSLTPPTSGLPVNVQSATTPATKRPSLLVPLVGASQVRFEPYRP